MSKQTFDTPALSQPYASNYLYPRMLAAARYASAGRPRDTLCACRANMNDFAPLLHGATIYMCEFKGAADGALICFVKDEAHFGAKMRR